MSESPHSPNRLRAFAHDMDTNNQTGCSTSRPVLAQGKFYAHVFSHGSGATLVRLTHTAMTTPLSGFSTLEELVAVLEKQGYSFVKVGEKNKPIKLDERFFRRIDKFDGDVGKFRSWVFDLVVVLGQVDRDLSEEVKKLMRETIVDLSPSEIAKFIDPEIYIAFAAELYGVICLLTTGDAKTVVKGVLEKGVGQDGFAALAALGNRFDAKTPANLLQAFMGVISPSPIKNGTQIPKAIVDWEAKIGALKNKHDEELGENIKLAVFVGMLPKEYQDICFQMGSIAGQTVRFKDIRDRVLNMANQRLQMAQPVPIDVDALQREEYQWGAESGSYDRADWEEQWQEYEIDEVGKGMCHKCGGWGHFARESPTKGKGKGKGYDTGGGKGYGGIKGVGKSHYGGKNGAKGYGKGQYGLSKGKGRGYQGECYRCGQVGHKAAECEQMIQQVKPEEHTQEACSIEVGGAWYVGCVEEKSARKRFCAAYGTCGGTCRAWGPHAPTKESNDNGGHQEHEKDEKDEKDEKVCCEIENPKNNIKTAREGTQEPKSQEFQTAASQQKNVKTKHSRTQSDRNPAGGPKNVKDANDEKDERTKGMQKQKMIKIKSKDWKKVQVGDEDLWDAEGCICVVEDEAGKELTQIGLGFQVADVKKPLLAVDRVVEKGNVVQFGPEEEDNFVMNRNSKEKIMMRKKGKSYVIDIKLKDGYWTEVTVDSAAEESVCPKEWAKMYEMKPVQEGRQLRLVNASGGPIKHYGQRDMLVHACLFFQRPGSC